MKYILRFLPPSVALIILLIGIICCIPDKPSFTREERAKVTHDILENYYNETFDVYIIKDCEYIISPSAGVSSLTHKGNCKFCMKRNKINDLD